jgi:hypothetical protein
MIELTFESKIPLIGNGSFLYFYIGFFFFLLLLDNEQFNILIYI